MKEKVKKAAEMAISKKITAKQAIIGGLLIASLIQFGSNILTIFQYIIAIIFGAVCWLLDFTGSAVVFILGLLLKGCIFGCMIYLIYVVGTYAISYIRERMKK